MPKDDDKKPPRGGPDEGRVNQSGLMPSDRTVTATNTKSGEAVGEELPEPSPDHTLTAADTSTHGRLDADPRPDIRRDMSGCDPDRYEVLDEHARGGLGRVLRVRDRKLGRTVAIKELITATATAEERFVREGQITARLEHPSIVPVYEAGAWPGGKPFYAMKLVAGRPLSKLIAEKGTLAERLSLLPNVLAVADAVAYAHKDGVIHRDLKPSNIVIGDYGETVVIDWGLAKELNSAGRRGGEPVSDDEPAYRLQAEPGLTRAGAVLGTPSFMPPEQARGQTVDERTDVYALGAILYNLLAGKAPFAGRSGQEIVQALQAEALPTAVRLGAEVPADLRAIVAKAMRLDARERYDSAAQLAADLRRYQTGQLVSAQEYTYLDRLAKWGRRHRVVLSSALGALVVSVVVGVVGAVQVLEERSALRAATKELTLAQAKTEAVLDPTAAILWLRELPNVDGVGMQAKVVADEAIANGVASWVVPPNGKLVESLSFTSNGRALLISEGVGQRVLDMPRNEVVTIDNYLGETAVADDYIVASQRSLQLFAVSDDDGPLEFERSEIYEKGQRGRLLVGGGIAAVDDGSRVRVFRLDNEGPSKVLPGNLGKNRLGSVSSALSANGRWLVAVGTDQKLRIWNTETAAGFDIDVLAADGPDAVFSRISLGEKPASDESGSSKDSGDKSRSREVGFGPLAISANGRFVAVFAHTVAFSLGLFLVDVQKRKTHLLWTPSKETPGLTHRFSDLVFSPDENLLYSAERGGLIESWSTVGARKRRDVFSSRGNDMKLSLSPDGSLLAAAGYQFGAVLISTGEERISGLRGHRGQVIAVAFSRGSDRVATADTNGEVRVWQTSHLARGQAERTGACHESIVVPGMFAAVGHSIIYACDDGRVWARKLSRGVMKSEPELLARVEGAMSDLAVSLDGRTVAVGTTKELVRIVEGQVTRHAGNVSTVAVSPEGGSVFWYTPNTLWRLDDDDEVPENLGGSQAYSPYAMAVSPDGTEIALGYSRGLVRHSLVKQKSTILPGQGFVDMPVTYSPDNRFLAFTDGRATVKVVDRSSGRVVPLMGHQGSVVQTRFSSRGQLATASTTGELRVWDMKSRTFRTLRCRNFPEDVDFVEDNSSILVLDTGFVQWFPNETELDKLLPSLEELTNARFSSEDKRSAGGRWSIAARSVALELTP